MTETAYNRRWSKFSTRNELCYCLECALQDSQQLPYCDKNKYLKFNDNSMNKSSFYFIYLKFFIHWVLIINTDVQCVPISPSLIILPFPLLCSFLSLSPQSFSLGRNAAVIKSWDVPGGTYYVERTNSTMFPAFCLPVGLCAIDLGGRCQYKERRKAIIIVIKLLLQHVHTAYKFDICGAWI